VPKKPSVIKDAAETICKSALVGQLTVTTLPCGLLIGALTGLSTTFSNNTLRFWKQAHALSPGKIPSYYSITAKTFKPYKNIKGIKKLKPLVKDSTWRITSMTVGLFAIQEAADSSTKCNKMI